MLKRATLFLGLILLNKLVYSQCAMCKAVAESNIEGGGVFGTGLNTGILYLMAFPYLLLFLFGTIWFFNKKKQAQQ